MKITNTLKEKSKEICSLSAYVIAATVIASPLAFAAPFQVNSGTASIRFRTAFDSASGCSSNSTYTFCFDAQAYDELLSGSQQGFVMVESYPSDFSSSDYGYIYCRGTAYGGSVSTAPNNGNTSVQATLNPSDPSCFTDNWNGGTVTINLSGSYIEGGQRQSNTGKSTIYSNGTTYKSDFKSDSFAETFTGSITGASGPWFGSATASRQTNRQQVK